MTRHVIKATIFDRRGNVLARAVNSYTRTHPIQAAFAKAGGCPERIYLHAEIAALIKLKERGNDGRRDRPYRIAVERYTKDGKPANSAPCPVCLAALKHYNIVKVEHTI